MNPFDIKIRSHSILQDFEWLSSENPINSIWNNLLLFSDLNLLKRAWKDRSEDDYIYVSTSIQQSYEYYKASEICTIKTRPLLLYYCFMNLTRAILFLKTDKKPNTEHHGLYTRGVHESILQTSAATNDGLFKDLSEYFGYNPPKNTELAFEEFIKSIPELTLDLRNFFGIRSNLHSVDVTSYIDGDVDISIPKVDYDTFPKYKNLLSDFHIVSEGNFVRLKYGQNPEWEVDRLARDGTMLLSKYFQYSLLGDGYYFNVGQNDIPICSAYYGATFILSSIVRYHPVNISNLSLDRGENSAPWFINQFCNVAARVYPNLMFNIVQKPVKYVR